MSIVRRDTAARNTLALRNKGLVWKLIHQILSAREGVNKTTPRQRLPGGLVG